MRYFRVALGVIATAIAPAAAAGDVSVSVSPAYAVGSFGQVADTRIYYVPLQLRYDRAPWSAAVTFSYLSVHGPVILTAGGVSGSSTTTTSGRSGVGDTWLEGSYRISGDRGVPDFVPYIKSKLATAHADKGLGSGENDYESGVSLEWVLGTRWFPFLAAGYRWVGEPPGSRTRNIAVYQFGLSALVGGYHYLTGMFVGNQSALADSARAADLVFAWNRSPPTGLGVQAYVDIGLSDGSPDYGVGLSLNGRF